MRVFTDYHHAGLYHSLQLLFEKRLGWELYRAIGPEWYHEGYWKVYDHPHTVDQFLGLHQASEVPKDVHSEPLTENERKNLHYVIEDGVYYIHDPVHECNHRAVTFDRFKDMEFDIVISSMPQHINPFNDLIARYQPSAKHIFQVGNAWGHQPGVQNILSSTAPFQVPSGINVCYYHQEFDLGIYKYELPKFHNVVHSYVHYMQQSELMNRYASYLPGWQWTRFGAGMDLAILESRGVADAMRRSAFTWHFKPEGDGFGHSIHGSYACGRPCIIWGSYYKGKLAENLLQDQVTCIDLSLHSEPENLRLIKQFSRADEHIKMCENAYNKFIQCVDFDAQFEERIRPFLERLI